MRITRKNPLQILSSVLPLVLVFSGYATRAAAAPVDISTFPIYQSSSVEVLPNLMYILDDSGSMGWDYMPDSVNDGGNCRSDDGSDDCRAGDPPYYAADFNTVFYNPAISYTPAVNADGSSKGSYASPWNNVPLNAFDSSAGNINLVNNFPGYYHCTESSPTSGELNNPSKCRRNGINNGSPFDYRSAGYPNSTFDNSVTIGGAPHYFKISAREHCSDAALTTCVLATAPTTVSGTLYGNAAPVRYCQTLTMAGSTAVQSGNSGGKPRCQKKYDSDHTYPRYGDFSRTDIVSGNAPFPKAVTRTDCSGATCSYAEEMTNFANWYAYYRTRMQTMKTATGRAFTQIDDKYRVGFITINPGSPSVSSSEYLKIDKFTAGSGGHKEDWYDTLYSQATGPGTPLRQALARVGRHYGGKTDSINTGMNDDPIQYYCQQNFALLTTDGYWNGSDGVKLDSSDDVDNEDNVDSGWSTRAVGAYDGGLLSSTEAGSSAGGKGTLADVAMYYYKTDLRPTMQNKVRTTDKDSATHQHMTTFTLGLGLDGKLDYRPDYESATTGDFYKIKNGSTGCSWAGGTCNWPAPQENNATALDDLWHAAVNGRGTYYSARDPVSIGDSLGAALANLKTSVGSAAAAATSTPVITPADRYIFSTTYRTVKWDGEVEAYLIDPATGFVQAGAQWSARTQLATKVSTSSDTRTIWTFDATTPVTKLRSFSGASLGADLATYFSNKCGSLSQCSVMAAADQSIVNSGTNMVNFLRGQSQYETTHYRDREYVLGDTVNATPVFVRESRFRFTDDGYSTFKNSTAIANRAPTVYIGANDGMLHAIDSDTGNERWAYVPRMLFPNLFRLADDNYGNNHRFYVDGSPTVMDVFIGGEWRTILVSGLNSGGRGYFALDVTNPAAPRALWEFCHDATLCMQSDPDMGLSYGNPVITKRKSDGKWVVLVTSGFNNASPGDGKGRLYVLDAQTGAVLDEILTPDVDNGLSKLEIYTQSGFEDNTALLAFAGDLQGNIWRFDLSGASFPAPLRMATLKDGSGNAQPVTTKPVLGKVDAALVIFIGTGKLLGMSDLTDYSKQTVYAIKDSTTAYGDPRSVLVEQVLTAVAAGRTITNNPVDWSAKSGWYVDLDPGGDSPGERVNVDVRLVQGTLVVVGNNPPEPASPSTDICKAAGEGRLYNFNFRTGSSISTMGGFVSQGTDSSMIAGIVVVQLPDGSYKAIRTLSDVSAGGASGVAHLKTSGVAIDPTNKSGRRVNWRELQ